MKGTIVSRIFFFVKLMSAITDHLQMIGIPFIYVLHRVPTLSGAVCEVCQSYGSKRHWVLGPLSNNEPVVFS